jgi:hypothetical protein
MLRAKVLSIGPYCAPSEQGGRTEETATPVSLMLATTSGTGGWEELESVFWSGRRYSAGWCKS